MTTTDRWIDQLYELSDRGRVHEATDLLLGNIDTALEERRFDIVDRWLRDVRFEALALPIVLAWLSFTLAAKTELRERDAAYARIAALVATVEPERRERLLQGLR